MNCRACAALLGVQLVDLGAAPPSNAFNESADAQDLHYPLRVMVCTSCGLAQTDITLFRLDHDQVFTKQYPYFSSTSRDWVAHARAFVEKIMAQIPFDSLTVEVGCNDGYLLQWVRSACYGIEPTATGEKAKAKGITVIDEFFTEHLAQVLATQRKADLMICNNVLAHVPDINDFVRGFAALLTDNGIATFEFPHLLKLIEGCQFDTIYHEHYSYLSLTATINIFKVNGLSVFHVEQLPTHGGSLRVYAQKSGGPQPTSIEVLAVLAQEKWLGEPSFYASFQHRADHIKNELLEFLLRAKKAGKRVAGFGAAAKANTLLNYAGIRTDLLPYIVDETPAKQGKFMPGSRIPVHAHFVDDPELILILPWNFRDEIVQKLKYMRDVGAKFVLAFPSLEVF